jgi:hypothetical protein
LKCTFILAINSPINQAIRFFHHKIGQIGYPYREPLQLAVGIKQGFYPALANDLNFIAISEAQFKQSTCPETVMFVRLRDEIEIKPIAYMDLDEFHDIAERLMDRCGPDLELGNDYFFVFELANRIQSQLHLI